MKRIAAAALIALVACSASAITFKDSTDPAKAPPAAEKKSGPAVTGAVPGEWTMDFDAAKKVAAEKKIPLFLNFTGSDWCGWCKLMDRNVFGKPEWQAYAKENLMLVWIDFPSDKTLVPEQFVARNQALQREYGVRGYPTYIILESDGTTKLGQLGASQEATPESFILEVRKLELNRPDEIEKWLDKTELEEMKAIEKAKAEAEAAGEKIGETYNKSLQKAYEANRKAEAEVKRASAEAKAEAEKTAAETKKAFDELLEKARAEMKPVRDSIEASEKKLNALFEKALKAREAAK